MEEEDFASTTNDRLMVEGLLYLRFKSLADSDTNVDDVVSKWCKGLDFKKEPIKKMRRKRLKSKDAANVLKGLGFGFERKRMMKKRSKRSPRKDFTNVLKRLGLANDNQEQTKLPARFKEKIEEMEGSEVKLVIQKRLTGSDLNPNNGRFSIPKGSIQEKNFLTPLEESSLDIREGKNNKIIGMTVSVLSPNFKLFEKLCFKKWTMTTTEVYNITHGWNNLASENLLQVNDLVQLWSFRIHHKLHFALVKP